MLSPPKFCTILHLFTASFSPLLDFCLNKGFPSFFSSIVVIPFMLSPPSSAHFFTSHCIVFSAARFLSQQGASFFLQLHHHRSLSCSHPQVLHNSCPLFNTLFLKLASLKSNSTVSVQSSVIPWCKTFVLFCILLFCLEVVAGLRFVNFFFLVFLGFGLVERSFFLFSFFLRILVFVVACNTKKMREEDQILVVATVVTPVSSKTSKKKQKFSYDSLTLRIHVTLALLQVSYGGFQVLTRVALLGGLSQFVFAIYRNGIAALVLAPFAYFLESNKRPSYFKFSDFLRFQALAFTGIVGSQQLFLAGLSLTSPMLAAVSQNVIPVCTFLLSAFLGLEDVHIRRRDGIAKVIGTVICVGGAVFMSLYKGEVLLVWSSSNMQPEVDDAVIIQPFTSLTMCLGTSVASMSVSKFQLGCIFLVLNSVFWAVYLNLQVSTLKIFPAPLTVTVYTYLFGVIQVGILGAVFEGMPNFALTSFNELISVAYATVVASGINFLLQLWCVEKGGPFIVSLYVPIQMIVVAMLSILTLGDPLYMGIVLGGFSTLAGLYLVVYGQAHERWLKQLQAEGLDSMPDLERFGGVKEATDLRKPLLSS